MITHYDLFAGIGGFSLALEEVFDEPIRHIFCEWEQFPTSVLRQHYPDSEFWGDIAELVAYTEGKRLERGSRSKPTDESAARPSQFTIITGGFPCQPFSAAGRRKGTADDRYKWPEMFAVIRNVKPTWVVAENVRGLVTWNDGMVLEQVCSDLESEGYEVQPLIIPAVAVNVPHRRDRVWIIANRVGQRLQGSRAKSELQEPAKSERQTARYWPDWSRNWQEVAFATCDDAVDARLPYWLDYFIGREGGVDGSSDYQLTKQDLRDLRRNLQSEAFREAFGRCYEIPETEILWKVMRQLPKGRQGEPERIQFGGTSFEEEYLRSVWEQPRFSRSPHQWEHYRKSAEQHNDTMPELSRKAALELAKAWRYSWMVLGTLQTRAVETDEIKLSAAAHRKESLKAYGNGIVPQVAMEIMKAIKSVDRKGGIE